MKKIIVAVLIAAALSTVSANPLSEAMAANARGDYATELEITRPLAASGVAWAQSFLGDSFRVGRGVTQNFTEAAKWYQLAAEQGHDNAQFNLGVLTHNGEGVLQDFAEAAKWYRLAAEQGHDGAQQNLGAMYSDGRGVVQDYAEAVKWYRLAAAQGRAGAQYNLGLMHGRGHGVAKDFKKAYVWFNLAAANGYGGSVRLRDIVAKTMTAEQLGEAQTMARQCMERNFKGCD